MARGGTLTRRRHSIRGEKEEYYIRAGSSFLPTPHTVLAGLFGQTPSANLELIVRLQTISGHPGQFCRIIFAVSVLNTGRGIADDLFLNTEWKLPSGSTINFSPNNAFTVWQTTAGNRRTMMSREYPPLPPSAENHVVAFGLDIHQVAGGDAIIDLDCGMRRGPGTSASIPLPRKLLDDMLAHYTHDYRQDTASKRAGDERFEALVRECIGRSG